MDAGATGNDNSLPMVPIPRVERFTGWVQFFTEWQRVVKQLCDDWPYPKLKIQNPHDDWEQAYQQIDTFLR